MSDLTYEGFRKPAKEFTLDSRDWRLENNQWTIEAKSRQALHTKRVCDRIRLSNSKPPITISFAEGFQFSLPHHFTEIAEQIEKSRFILELNDNWDDEGSIAYSQKTFATAATFVIKYCEAVWEEESVLIDAPTILPGPKGSIDLLWDKTAYRLLINIHPDPDMTASFYGDNRTQVPHIKGDFLLSDEPERAIILLLLKEKQ